jgi:hypothetical protein
MRKIPKTFTRPLFSGIVSGIALLMLASLSACDKEGGNPATVTEGGDKGKSPCAAPQVLYAPSFIPGDADGTRDGILTLAVDGADAFFTTLSAVYRVPAAGGEPVKMQVDHRGSLFVVDGRVFLVNLRQPTGQIKELHRTGGEVSALPIAILPEAGQTLVSPLWMDATHLYYQSQSSDLSSASYKLYRIAWNGGASEKLADLSGRGIGEAIQIGRAFLKGGETLYFTTDVPGTAPDTLYSLPAAGGIPSRIRTQHGFDFLLAADAGYLYMDMVTDTSLYTKALVRRPHAGGEFQPIPGTGNGNALYAWLDGDRMVFLPSEIFLPEGSSIPILLERITTVPKAGGTAAKAGCIDTDAYTLHDRSYSGKFLYAAAEVASTRKYTVLRYPVP